jgi:hypothetical protein
VEWFTWVFSGVGLAALSVLGFVWRRRVERRDRERNVARNTIVTPLHQAVENDSSTLNRQGVPSSRPLRALLDRDEAQYLDGYVRDQATDYIESLDEYDRIRAPLARNLALNLVAALDRQKWVHYSTQLEQEGYQVSLDLYILFIEPIDGLVNEFERRKEGGLALCVWLDHKLLAYMNHLTVRSEWVHIANAIREAVRDTKSDAIWHRDRIARETAIRQNEGMRRALIRFGYPNPQPHHN